MSVNSGIVMSPVSHSPDPIATPVEFKLHHCPNPESIPVFGDLLLICRVRHRFRATFSRQPRQVRKEATVTGSFVCSGAPVPDFYLSREIAQVSVKGRAQT